MTEKYNKLRNVVVITLSILFAFLILLVKASIAKETTAIEGKIEATEQMLAEERFKLRFKEAKEYMEKGDRYYAAGKLQEALGEWYAALALLDLLQGVDVRSSIDTCAKLGEEIKSRINSEENKTDRRRQAQIEKRVREVLDRRLKEEQAAEKQQASLPKIKPVTAPAALPIEPVVKSEGTVSLQELEVMKQNRQAVEDMISQDIVKNRNDRAAQAKAEKLKQEDMQSQEAMESAIAQELASEKKAGVSDAVIDEKAQMERIQEQERLERQNILAQEEAARLKEAQLVKQNEELKAAAEAAVLKDRQDAKAQEELKKQAEGRIQAKLEEEAKQNQELKARTEKLESDRLNALMRERQKSSQVENQLRVLEKKTKDKEAKKRTVKKEKRKAKKSSKEKAAGPSLSTSEEDKFDLIDKVLTSYDYYQDNSYRRY